MRKKRFIAYLLCVAMLMFCVACGKKDTPATESPTETAQPGNQQQDPGNQPPADTGTPVPADPIDDALKNDAPEHYDFAVEVSINPDFLLFVTGQEVVGYKALNEDAKKIEDRCVIIGRPIDGAVDDIVRFSEQDGYLKDGGTVNMTIVSANCPKAQADEAIQRAEETIQRVTEDIGIQVAAEVHVEQNIEFAPEPDNPPGPDPNDPNGQPGPDPNDPNGQPGPDPNDPNGQPGPDPNDPNGQPEPDPNDPNNPDPNDPGNETHEPRKPDEGCSVCWGTGVCERCDGTGLVDCMRCNGTGKEGNGVCPDCNGAGRCECEQCHGTKKCPACGGTGKKPDD
jgi:hypothetical protein